MSDRRFYDEQEREIVGEVSIRGFIITEECDDDAERHAWERFASSAPYSDPILMSGHADALLTEWRKRFRKADP